MGTLDATQRRALVVASGLTAFALVLVGAVAHRIAREPGLAPPTATFAPEPGVLPAAAPDTVVQALIDQRDAEYQALVGEANQRLEIANARLRAAEAALAARPGAIGPQDFQPAPQPAYLSPDQAAGIALGVEPGAFVWRTPELVDFQGTAAYEVITDRGAIYVDALLGRVLLDGAAGAVAANNVGGGGGGEREDGERDDEERDAEGERNG